MKRILHLLGIFAILFSISCTKEQFLIIEDIKAHGKTNYDTTGIFNPVKIWKDTIHLLGIKGQSNGAGRIKYDEYIHLSNRYMIYNQDTTFVQTYNNYSAHTWQVMDRYKNVSDASGGNAGIQPIIAKLFMDKYGENLYIYQTARSGRRIEAFTKPEFEPAIYDHQMRLKQVIDSFKAKDIYVNVIGTVWYQGETDGGVDTIRYKKEFKVLMDINKQIFGHDAPFIVIQMSDGQWKVPQLPALQKMQSGFSRDYPHVKVINNMGNCPTKGNDGLHPVYSVIRAQGELAFQALFN